MRIAVLVILGLLLAAGCDKKIHDVRGAVPAAHD